MLSKWTNGTLHGFLALFFEISVVSKIMIERRIVNHSYRLGKKICLYCLLVLQVCLCVRYNLNEELLTYRGTICP